MKNLIEIYVNEVISRLPENERGEIEQELYANIYDMLPENPDEFEIKGVLQELGDPRKLANQYRRKPRYLISPEIYDDYIRVLKWIVPLVAGVVFAVGMIVGLIGGLEQGINVFQVLLRGIGEGIHGALHGLVWVTIGFTVIDKTGLGTTIQYTKKEWSVEDLPKEIPNKKYQISRTDTIIEVALEVIFSMVFITMLIGSNQVLINSLGNINIQNLTFFTAEFVQLAVPALSVLIILAVIEGGAKIIKGQWTPVVCGIVIVTNVIGAVIALFVLMRENILSTEFLNLLETHVNNLFMIGFRNANIGIGGDFSVATVIIVLIIVIATLYACGEAVYKTIKNYLQREVS